VPRQSITGGTQAHAAISETCIRRRRAAEEVAAGRAEAAEQRAWLRQAQQDLGRRAEALAAGEAKAEAAAADAERRAAQLQVRRPHPEII